MAEHLEKNVSLLANILLEVHTYSGSPFRHTNNYRLKEHFDRWMEIFTQTTDSLFTGALAEEAKFRAKNG
jgi:hemoglobin